MSEADDGPGRREVAYRVFAAEYDDATHSYSESDEERAPSYVVTPTGARANRLFVVGVLTEVEPAGESNLRARVVDPTGAFVVYAGQYEPDPLAALQRIDPPAFVAVTGKARTFEPEDGDRVFSTLRPEAINEVDAGTRDRWVVRTAEHTLARVAAFADAMDRPERGDDLRRALLSEGVDPGLAAGIPRAIDAYHTTPGYLGAVRDLALDAARVVAGERESVEGLDYAPDEAAAGEVDLDLPIDAADSVATAAIDPDETTVDATDSEATTGEEPAADTTAPSETTAQSADEQATADEQAIAGDQATDTAAEPADTAAEKTESPAAEADATPEHEDEPAADSSEAAASEADAAGGSSESPDEIDADADTDEFYELDEEEREAVEEEYGVEFASGEEIPDAGEADIDTPDPEELAPEGEAGAEPGADTGAETDAGTETEADADTDDSEATTDESAEDESLEDAAVNAMRALADEHDGGAPREAVIERVTADRDVESDAVEDAIQEALMSGRCYESGDDELTPI